uniref:Uncharacterized protein LOC104214732 n=1 Tax=Nicotiana sylvestris TaxID=4096 RepID=A0A1U7V8N1_NICSY|nr:PREDICTED: uncharacterized protein LOC104214732 [Nicotiana sylvestris]
MKWLWKFAADEQSLWTEVVTEKYGMEEKWTTKSVRTPYGVGVWKSIRNLWPKLINKSKFKVGNGRKISLWDDNWLGQRPLKDLFPGIYSLNQQQVTLHEAWTNQGWNLTFRRLLNDWEIERVTDFYNTLERFSGTNSNQDLIVWQRNRQGRLSVGSAYKEFNLSNDQDGCWP